MISYIDRTNIGCVRSGILPRRDLLPVDLVSLGDPHPDIRLVQRLKSAVGDAAADGRYPRACRLALAAAL